ncbi:aminodeoxychorismate synthase component I [Sandarakinorhabdus sp. DWP1-3-1]|uniref:aminodeoxychorismate synthase component I n=1 Tax=Sandarakinorhabdus sp. DWP1-3-1 TaxID=2804627 RepID=UPI003CEB7BCD
MFDPARPFVLLDDVAAGTARLFSGLVETVVAETPDAVLPGLERLRAPGPWAGFMGFEAGYALEPRLVPRAPPAGEPLLWFGRFADDRPAAAETLLPGGPATVGAVAPGVARGDHDAQLARILALIAAGDIYQANLTFGAAVAVGGHPLALYARLRAGSRAPYGALVFTGALWLLSFSPELFFRLDGQALTARPMKGTAARGHDAADDAARAAALQADPKNRAENLMITDLLRNDLSRVGSDVRVPALFAIETYPTVLQMTSTVTAVAHPGVVAADVLARLFPCGSVTGAPKIRAMEVIAEVEAGPRGAYTGSIGAISTGGDAVFSVAIRTLVMAPGADAARLGLGSGIVADSDAGDEWAECLAKSAFLQRRGPPDLIETMRCEAGLLPDLERHLARMAASAGFFGWNLDVEAARDRVLAAVSDGISGRIRLIACSTGATAVQVSPLPAPLAGEVAVALARLPVDPADWRLRHKTGDRAFYDDARRAAGTFEVALVRADGWVTEGSFTSIFVERDDVLVTPPLALGLLPGVFRARLIAEGLAVEGMVTVADLAGGFYIGNALRGLMAARLA